MQKKRGGIYIYFFLFVEFSQKNYIKSIFRHLYKDKVIRLIRLIMQALNSKPAQAFTLTDKSVNWSTIHKESKRDPLFIHFFFKK